MRRVPRRESPWQMLEEDHGQPKAYRYNNEAKGVIIDGGKAGSSGSMCLH
ncbi:hypothetical protein TIFTF001_007551 [Ficus carica]|uniref:Uncharacterized protein n=1 Tax=Ficus carica TaxID=3494 RepID=A0AA87ZTH7_FICCA|nr:hypothetical protein TIFTF001_007551 [Ficus carica]